MKAPVDSAKLRALIARVDRRRYLRGWSGFSRLDLRGHGGLTLWGTNAGAIAIPHTMKGVARTCWPHLPTPASLAVARGLGRTSALSVVCELTPFDLLRYLAFAIEGIPHRLLGVHDELLANVEPFLEARPEALAIRMNRWERAIWRELAEVLPGPALPRLVGPRCAALLNREYTLPASFLLQGVRRSAAARRAFAAYLRVPAATKRRSALRSLLARAQPAPKEDTDFAAELNPGRPMVLSASPHPFWYLQNEVRGLGYFRLVDPPGEREVEIARELSRSVGLAVICDLSPSDLARYALFLRADIPHTLLGVHDEILAIGARHRQEPGPVDRPMSARDRALWPRVRTLADWSRVVGPSCLSLLDRGRTILGAEALHPALFREPFARELRRRLAATAV